MHGLSLTYQILAQSRNQASLDVLVAAIDSTNPSLVTMAISAITQRTVSHRTISQGTVSQGTDTPGAKEVLQRWDRLSKKEIAILRKASPWMDAILLETLNQGTGDVGLAIQAAKDLQLTAAIEPMVLLAESSSSSSVRKAATHAVLELVVPLGRAARKDKSSPAIRNSVLTGLANSVNRFDMHRNEMLIEAFLCTTTCGDGDLRRMIGERGPAFDLISNCFQTSEHPSVIELLASFIRRRQPDDRITKLMHHRTDDAFRDALLDKIGSSPTGTTLKNLQDLGIPATCKSAPSLMPNLDPTRRTALVHLYIGASSNTIAIMQTIVSAIKSGGPGCETVAAKGLSSCEVMDIEFWMRAAVPVAENDVEEIACDENAQLLQELIDLLDHADAGIVDGVRHVLSPMHASAMLPRMAKLRARSRRRIGRVVMMIDADAIERVRDALRHPVLEHRVEAIAMADSLALVDLLSDSFLHISTEDHQQARICAAEAMGDASGKETMQLLESMVRMPVSPVRDAAELAIQRREKRKPTKSTAGRR